MANSSDSLKQWFGDKSTNRFCLIAGPCAIENYDQFSSTSSFVLKNGAGLIRGGIHKLRTSPKSFQGMGEEAIEIVKHLKKDSSFKFISEITDPRQLEELDEVVDVYQVGSRNMYNESLLAELGQTDKPVVLKRGFVSTVDEWLSAADFLVDSGNDLVALCERGIRTFETTTRNTFDLNSIAYVKEYSNYKVIADPSHATGDKKLVEPMSLAAIAAGADGLIVEVHPDPDNAKSDGQQSLEFKDFSDLVLKSKQLLGILNKEFIE